MRKHRKLKVRIPMPPPQRPHSSKKGNKGYARQNNKQTIQEGVIAMAEQTKASSEAKFEEATRNLDLETIAMLKKDELSPEEEERLETSVQLKYARKCALEIKKEKGQ